MPDLRLGRPSMSLKRGSLLDSLLSRSKRRGRRRVNRGSSSGGTSGLSLEHMTRSEKEAYFANPQVQRALANQREEERAEVRLESDLEYRAFQMAKESVAQQRADEKQAFEQDKERYQRNKDLVYKSMELLDKARSSGNRAYERNALKAMKGYIGQLDPHMQAQLGPTLATGVFSPEAEKMRKWDESNGPAPEVTANFVDQPYLAAKQIGEAEAHRARRASYRTGTTVPPRELIPMGDMAWYKGAFVTEEDLDAEGFSKEFKIPAGQVKAQGGYKSPISETRVDGDVYKSYYKVSWPGRVSSIEYEGKQPSKEKKAITDFTALWGNWDSIKDSDKESASNSLVAIGKKLIEDEKWTIEEFSDAYVKRKFGYNIVEGPDDTVIPIPGKRIELEGAEVYLSSDDFVTNADGEFLGNLQEARRIILVRKGQMLQEEGQKENWRKRQAAKGAKALKQIQKSWVSAPRVK